MKSKDLVSIIIPVYNVEEYIEKCIKSVQRQTYENIEILLIDDGSSDLSGSICDRFQEKDCRIRVVHKKNGGLSDARNVGIRESNGKYLMFVDGDDVVSQDIVMYLYQNILLDNASMSICNLLNCYPGDDILFLPGGRIDSYSKEEILCKMWYQDEILMSACGKLYKRELFEELQFEEGLLYEDVNIMHELVWKCNRITYGRGFLYGYLHREESITTKKFNKRDMDILKICDNIMRFSEDKSKKIQCAAKAYYIVGNFRIYLNAPNNFEYLKVTENCEKNICLYGKEVLKDKNIRKKLKGALYLFLYARPLMKLVYKKVDRWR